MSKITDPSLCKTKEDIFKFTKDNDYESFSKNYTTEDIFEKARKLNFDAQDSFNLFGSLIDKGYKCDDYGMYELLGSNNPEAIKVINHSLSYLNKKYSFKESAEIFYNYFYTYLANYDYKINFNGSYDEFFEFLKYLYLEDGCTVQPTDSFINDVKSYFDSESFEEFITKTNDRDNCFESSFYFYKVFSDTLSRFFEEKKANKETKKETKMTSEIEKCNTKQKLFKFISSYEGDFYNFPHEEVFAKASELGDKVKASDLLCKLIEKDVGNCTTFAENYLNDCQESIEGVVQKTLNYIISKNKNDIEKAADVFFNTFSGVIDSEYYDISNLDVDLTTQEFFEFTNKFISIYDENGEDFVKKVKKYLKEDSFDDFVDEMEDYENDLSIDYYYHYLFSKKFEKVFKEMKSSQTQKEKTKTDKKEISKTTDWAKERIVEGMYQGAAKKAVTEVTNSISKAAQNANPMYGAIFDEFAKSDVGFAVISSLIGLGVKVAPFDLVQDNEKIQKIADKCAENGAAAGTEAVLEVIINHIKPALELAAKNIVASDLPKIRVADKSKNEEQDEISEEELAVVKPLKRSSK